MPKILISAGHQPGLDSGAVGQGQQEANENVRICDRVVLYLRAWGINTVYMPNNVGDLQAEINWANANFPFGQGYAIQIHRNAFNGQATGNEVWTTDYANQIPLATAISKAMAEITKLTNRGVKDIKTYNHPLGWINYVNSESVLIEARFIDRDSITDADDMIDAYAIACGIADFLKVPRGKSVEQEQILAATLAAEAAAKAKAEAEKQAQLAEQARINAEKALKAKQEAEAEAKRLAEEKAAADKALKDEVNNENLNILQLIFSAIKNIINAILAKKG